jgi:hypothetical protein
VPRGCCCCCKVSQRPKVGPGDKTGAAYAATVLALPHKW